MTGLSLEQLAQLGRRIGRRDQGLAHQERVEASPAQPSEVARGARSALCHLERFGGKVWLQRDRVRQVDDEGAQIAIVDADQLPRRALELLDVGAIVRLDQRSEPESPRRVRETT